MKIIAHRGNSWVAPQNTLAAFEAAHRVGAHAIELDIHPLADGQAAVIHDDTLDATTSGTGPVSALTTTELAQLDAGSWFSPAFAGQRVPLLDDVLEFLHRRTEVSILLEVKGVWEGESLARALASIEAAGLGERFVVQSFEVDTVAAMRDLTPDLTREWLIDTMRDDIIDVAYDLGARGANPNGVILLEHPDLVDELHAAGLHVSVWTLNEPEQWAAARTLGVDGIITDRPGMLRGWIAAP